MRTRLFVISSLAVAAVIGASSATAAHAYPKGPGGIDSKPTTTTTAPQDKAPKPTPTTVPKGPGDIAQPPKGGDPEPQPKPQGPGDIANPPSDPVVDPAPTGNGSGSDKDYGTTMGDDEGTPENTGGNGTSIDNGVDATSGDEQAPQAADNATADAPASSHTPVLVIAFIAALVGALLALFAGRFRRHDGDAPTA